VTPFQKWVLSGFVVILILMVMEAIVHQHQRRATAQAVAALNETALPTDVMRNLQAIPLNTWNRVGTGRFRPLEAVEPATTDPAIPTVLYIGSEFCPYCAAVRWPIVAALERFGAFTRLERSASSATDIFPGTPSVTFAHTRYQSPYLTMQAVEREGNTLDASGRYPPLQHLTPTQEAVFRRYDPSGAIPFLLIGGRYVLVGSPFSPAVLQRLDWRNIAAQLPGGTTPAARAILNAGNEISAAICAVNGDHPTAICQNDGERDAPVMPVPAVKTRVLITTR